MKLIEIQQNIENNNGDAWLFCDFQNRDRLAYDILGIDKNKLMTRRWYYFIPKKGEPIKLVHRIEQNIFDELPGRKEVYSGWEELHTKLRQILGNTKKVFMQYSPYNNIPTVSYVDGGTIELIRSFGVKILSSATLIQIYKSTLSQKGIELHKLAGDKVQKIKDGAFELIFKAVKENKTITEYDVQQFIIKEFSNENLTCEGELPIVAVNEHAANPHFETSLHENYNIKLGDRVLIDLWAKIDSDDGIYYDITWCGYVGAEPETEYKRLFDTVVRARQLAKQFILDRINKNESVQGWEVDKVCREFLIEKGFGEYFIHRTGHSIDTRMHGSGVNIDNLETKDEREIVPGVCFSIEPGIYKGSYGVRSEINVLIDKNNNLFVFGPEQSELVLMK